jgi:hypothetical protein
MKNIHLLPTDKPSRLALLHNDKLHIGTSWKKDFNVNPQNIYITSDEEIKEGDNYLNGKYLYKADRFYKKAENDRKIILTTDQDLIKDGVQAIDDEFLEWFVKNPSCEFVDIDEKTNKEIQIEIGTWGHDEGLLVSELKEWLENGGELYKIIIPKETLSYTEAAKKDERIFNSTIMKQETIEEAAFESSVDYKPFEDNLSPKQYYKQGFINGAKSDAARDYWFEIFLKQKRNKDGQ